MPSKEQNYKSVTLSAADHQRVEKLRKIMIEKWDHNHGLSLMNGKKVSLGDVIMLGIKHLEQQEGIK